MTWTSVIGRALAARVSHRVRLFEDAQRRADTTQRVQTSTLRRLLTHAAGTRFGRAHDFRRLSRVSDSDLWTAYRSATPVRDWYAFADDIASMREGTEPDVLWPGLVRDFAQTSGTTAGDKFIPVSKEMMRSNYRAGLDIFAHSQRFGLSLADIFSGGALFLGGSTTLSVGPGGVRTGDLSGLSTRLIRWPISQVYLPGADIALMDDWPAKIDAMAEMCAQKDVRMVSGMPSWGTVLFEKVLELTGKQTISEVWPNLRLFVHGGVRFEPFFPRFVELWRGDDTTIGLPERLELYPASEGFVAMQDLRNPPGDEFIQQPMALNTDIGLAFEFVPVEQIDDETPPAFSAHEVETGQRYVVVLTTCAGLWRYVLGDVVEFDATPAMDQPSRLRIVGRHRHFINAFGENIIVEHIEKGVAQAVSATGAQVGEFTAAPIYPSQSQRAGLEVVVEFRSPPTSMEAFARAFDDAVKACNVDYTTKRTGDRGMSLPRITPVELGTFHRWMASRGKLGGQHKCPRCANHRELVEGVLEVASGNDSTPMSKADDQVRI